jgi:hypothetical protein
MGRNEWRMEMGSVELERGVDELSLERNAAGRAEWMVTRKEVETLGTNLKDNA